MKLFFCKSYAINWNALLIQSYELDLFYDFKGKGDNESMRDQQTRNQRHHMKKKPQKLLKNQSTFIQHQQKEVTQRLQSPKTLMTSQINKWKRTIRCVCSCSLCRCMPGVPSVLHFRKTIIQLQFLSKVTSISIHTPNGAGKTQLPMANNCLRLPNIKVLVYVYGKNNCIPRQSTPTVCGEWWQFHANLVGG